MKKKNTLIIISGPTAVGKTALSVEIAQYFNTEILSADSRQCFKELNIGVAKPNDEQLKLVHHYFINSHSIFNEVNAGIYEQYALESLAGIFSKNKIAIAVGGTGLYIKALCEGVDEMPAISSTTRNFIIKNYEEKGLEWLQNELQIKDPLFWKNAEQQNPQRLMRALEVIEQTGKSILAFRKGNKAERDFNIIKVALDSPREELYNTINKRVDLMISEDLEEEAKGLYIYRTLNALQTVGYSEWFDYFDNKISYQEAVDKIKINTRHYAKRQLTWFRKDKDFHWFQPYEKENILSFLKSSVE
ncbi:MAG: tRNA (adenosine(37)-N6)-dimethylallyltransferase MiaA [Arachidicoccus sp.]|nr:tRNA (adenosine(37)-N6)-dimethylallyltransferase MiaA [Arachidicoccus sp.]